MGFNEYTAIAPPPAQVYSPPVKDLSWTGLPEFSDDTVTDYTRPTPSVDVSNGASSEQEGNNSSVFEQGGTSSNVMRMPLIQFVKGSSCPNVINVNNTEKVRKPTVKYADMHRNNKCSNVMSNNYGAPIIEDWESESEVDYTISETVRSSIKQVQFEAKASKQTKNHPRGNQRNWNNPKSQQLGRDFLMQNKACHNCGCFDHLASNCGICVDKEETWSRGNNSQNNVKFSSTHKSMTPRAVLLKTGPKPIVVNKPQMNVAQPIMKSFKTAHSNVKRPFERKTAAKNQIWVPKVPTGRTKIPTVGSKVPTAKPTGAADLGNKGKAVKASARWIWKPKDNTSGKGSNLNGVLGNINDKGLWDSGCSRHMTGNISYLSEYEPYDGGYVSFGYGGGKITGRGIIKTGKLEFENVYFVKELKYNLNNLVKGLPSKSFENDHTCVACLKGKQYKASFKTKLVNSVSKPLHTLHMDLFGPTSVSSLNHKWYFLVVTDDFSRNVDLFDTMIVPQGEGPVNPTEPHHTHSPQPESPPQIEHTIPTVSQETIPQQTLTSQPQTTNIPSQTPTHRRLTKRDIRIAQSRVPTPGADEPASLLRDDRHGEAFPTATSLDAGHDRENILKTSVMPHDSPPRVTSLGGDEGKIDSNKSTDKGSESIGEMANVLSSMGVANILASGGLKEVITIASPQVPPASLQVATAVATASERTPTVVTSTTNRAITSYTRRTRASRGIILESSQPS
ncbi:hypothetical protein Tco_0938923, partial [Tanacetum coccineum]